MVGVGALFVAMGDEHGTKVVRVTVTVLVVVVVMVDVIVAGCEVVAAEVLVVPL